MSDSYLSVTKKIPKNVTLIAVSKTKSVEAIEALYREGQRDFGENYVQELVQKAEVLKQKGCTGIRWHFIGHLQKNKVKTLLPHHVVIHTVDSLELAREIAKRKEALQIKNPVQVFIQINTDKEPSKSGILPEEVSVFCEAIAKVEGLEVLGLMCIPDPSRADVAEPFKVLKKLSDQNKNFLIGKLSMGMSSDFEEAIRCGATHVRIGTALFGSRV